MRLAAPLALCALALAACGSPGPGAPGPPSVVASINVYGAIASTVAGDRAQVSALVTDPAADPHSYESTPAAALKVADARVVVLNGGGYDPFMGRLVDSAGGQRAVVDVSELSGLEPAGADKQGGEQGGFNEHVWYSLPTVQKLATRLAAELSAVDPAGAATFTANADAFSDSVTKLTRKAAAIGAAAPGARVAVTEPVPDYLIETAGLTDATPPGFARAIEEDSDPPAAVVQQTLALFSGPQKVRALILNAQTQTPITEQVRRAAEAADVPVVEVTETLPAGVGDYVTWMDGQINALDAAVNRGQTR